MLIQAVKNTVRGNHLALGAVLAFGLAGHAFAGTSLSCAGFPKNVLVFTNGGAATFVQVCKIAALTAPLTPTLSVTGNAGNVTAHGGHAEKAIPVYGRIVARDANLAAANKLANSVVISTANGAVSSNRITILYPRSLEVDYEVFTPSTTEVSVSTQAGMLAADNYSVLLNASTMAGDISLHAIDGDVHAKAVAGNITINLGSTAWTGSGLTASTSGGNILLSRPEGYQARITATANFGEAEVDGKVQNFPFPATLSTGSGQPIKLTSGFGNVTVTRTTNQ